MTNSKFLAALGHTCFFVLTTITLEFIIGFVVALLLYREVAGSRVFRLIFAVPLMVAPVVSGLQWRWLFADQYGIINALMNKLGLEAPLWFTQVSTSWVTIIVANLWLATPFVILVLLAGLGGLSEELNEAASIDGAGRWAKIKYVTLPGIKPTIIILLLMNVGNVLNAGFEIQYLLGNGLIQDVSQTIDIYVLKWGISQGDYAIGTAAGIFKSVVSIILIFIANRIAKHNGEEQLF